MSATKTADATARSLARPHWARAAAFALALTALLAGAVLAAGKAPAGKTVTVTIDAASFAPKYVAVSPGDTVVWVNKDLLTHTATAKNGSFDSKEIAAGSSWTYKPTARGQFDYRCTLHPTMKGTLVVH